MTPLRTIFTALVLTAIVLSGYWFKQSFLDPQKTKVNSLAPTVESIQALSELVTNRVYISDILEANNKDYKGIWAINGDALITFDLSKVKIKDRNEDEQTITVILPQPKVISPRVDHDRSRLGSISGKGFAPLRNPKNRAKMMEDAMLEAQKLIEEAASKPKIMDNAKKQAQLVIQNVYAKVGWNVLVTWENASILP